MHYRRRSRIRFFFQKGWLGVSDSSCIYIQLINGNRYTGSKTYFARGGGGDIVKIIFIPIINNKSNRYIIYKFFFGFCFVKFTLKNQWVGMHTYPLPASVNVCKVYLNQCISIR